MALGPFLGQFVNLGLLSWPFHRMHLRLDKLTVDHVLHLLPEQLVGLESLLRSIRPMRRVPALGQNGLGLVLSWRRRS